MANVLITGANRGIGLEMVKLYAARGDTVLACCRNPSEAEALNAVEGDVEVIEVQVSDGASVANLASTLGDRPVDLLINNAGMAGPAYDQQNAYAMDFDGWAETFEVNTMAPVRVMQALMPNLKASRDARVVTITSQMGALSLDMPVAYAYCTSKAALNKFMKMAALELGKEGINICVIHPGWVQTDMGGPNAEITPQESAEGIVATIDGLNAETNGSFWKWNGETHGW
jgi:NAD(P)-dependent dehydrogenase (short-subunit alcohol dehydrogenase family)